MTMSPRIPLLALCIAMHAMPGLAQVVNHAAAGHPQAENALGCITLADAKSSDTPADLYPAVAACIHADRMEDAIDLMALGGAYGRFDAQRVADQTAHQANSVLLMQVGDGLTDAERTAFSEALKTLGDEPEHQRARCTQAARIGPSTYRPDYMIQHGMSAFTGMQGDGLVPGFDAAGAWSQIRASYLHCAQGASTSDAG